MPDDMVILLNTIIGWQEHLSNPLNIKKNIGKPITFGRNYCGNRIEMQVGI